MEEHGGAAPPAVPSALVFAEPVAGEIAARARKNLRRDVESKLAESNRRFLTAFSEVDKVRGAPVETFVYCANIDIYQAIRYSS